MYIILSIIEHILRDETSYFKMKKIKFEPYNYI